MRLLVISEEGYGLGIATHLSSEGHGVDFIIGGSTPLGQGIVSRVSEPVSASDIMIFDDEKFGLEADNLRKGGTRVLGASRWGRLVSEDEDYTSSIINSVGWETTDSSRGTNLYITAWFNGNKYVSTYASIVYKRLMSGGRGPDVDFTGVVSNFYQPTDRVRSEVLGPLEKILKRVGHRGAFHVHTLVNQGKLYVKSLSTSFNHPLSCLLFENSRLSTSDIILRLFDENSSTVDPIEEWASGVMISVPPFPYALSSEPISLKGVQSANLKHMWLVDAQKENGTWQTAGLHGKIGYVTARGGTVNEATKRVYRTIRNLDIKDLQYRDDVGRDLKPLLRVLKEQSWIK